MSAETHEEANKTMARDYVETVFNQGQPDLAAKFVTPEVVWHGGILGDVVGAENVVGMLRGFLGAFADLHAVEQDVIAEGDLVMLRLVITATQQGDLLGGAQPHHRHPCTAPGSALSAARPGQNQLQPPPGEVS